MSRQNVQSEHGGAAHGRGERPRRRRRGLSDVSVRRGVHGRRAQRRRLLGPDAGQVDGRHVPLPRGLLRDGHAARARIQLVCGAAHRSPVWPLPGRILGVDIQQRVLVERRVRHTQELVARPVAGHLRNPLRAVLHVPRRLREDSARDIVQDERRIGGQSGRRGGRLFRSLHVLHTDVGAAAGDDLHGERRRVRLRPSAAGLSAALHHRRIQGGVRVGHGRVQCEGVLLPRRQSRQQGVHEGALHHVPAGHRGAHLGGRVGGAGAAAAGAARAHPADGPLPLPLHVPGGGGELAAAPQLRPGRQRQGVVPRRQHHLPTGLAVRGDRARQRLRHPLLRRPPARTEAPQGGRRLAARLLCVARLPALRRRPHGRPLLPPAAAFARRRRGGGPRAPRPAAPDGGGRRRGAVPPGPGRRHLLGGRHHLPADAARRHLHVRQPHLLAPAGTHRRVSGDPRHPPAHRRLPASLHQPAGDALPLAARPHRHDERRQGHLLPDGHRAARQRLPRRRHVRVARGARPRRVAPRSGHLDHRDTHPQDGDKGEQVCAAARSPCATAAGRARLGGRSGRAAGGRLQSGEGRRRHGGARRAGVEPRDGHVSVPHLATCPPGAGRDRGWQQ